MTPQEAAGATVAAGGILFILLMAFYVFLCMFAVLAFAFWIWMIVDVVTNEPPGNDKIVWVLVVILLHWIGALIYYLARKRKRPKVPVVP